MGIKGLTGFISEYFDQWQSLTLVEATSSCGGKLIVDGNSLGWGLLKWEGFCKVDCSYGGPLLQFKEAVEHVFGLFKEEGISPIVVMDGVDYDGKKFAVQLARRQQRIHPISNFREPMFLVLFREVFTATLGRLNVPLYVADGDADETIAKLANHYSYPVLSHDSDYFIFNLSKGYIPLDKLDLNTKPIQVKVYCRTAFSEQFGFKDTSLCYAIPVIFGNDFLPKSQPWKESVERLCGVVVDDNVFIREGVKMVCEFLAEKYISFEEYKTVKCKEKEKAEACIKVQELYSVRETLNIEYLKDPSSSVLRHHSGSELPGWLLDSYRNGFIPPYIIQATVCKRTILPVMIDDIESETSTLPSKQIRQCLYALLDCNEVTEYVRVGEKLVPQSLTCKRYIRDMRIPSVLVAQTIDPSLFFAIFGCARATLEHSLGRHYERWMLYSIVTIYWAKHAAGNINHMARALIACSVLCYSDSQAAMQRYTDARLDLSRSKCKKAIHSFSQWQYVYHCALVLVGLGLLRSVKPLPPEKLYNDTLALHLACECKEPLIDSRVEKNAPKRFNLYKCLTKTVLEHLPPPPQTARGSIPTEVDVQVTNRFGILSDIESI